MKNYDETITRIGIFRALYLGDMLCIIPAVRAIRTTYPHAHITLIGLRWQEDFVERFHQYFDDFVDFPGWPGLPEQKFDAKLTLEFLSEMQRRSFDLVLQMHGNGVAPNILCSLFGAKQIAGLRKKNELAPDQGVFPVADDTEHEILKFLKLTDALNITPQGNHLEFPFHPSEMENARLMLRTIDVSMGNFICIHPGARDPKRRWSSEYFAFVADQLAEHGYRIIITGSVDESKLLQDVASRMNSAPINLVEQFGHVGLGELGFIISQSALLISNDTGVSHIAAALECPSVVVFSNYSLAQRSAPLNNDLHKAILPQHADDINKILDTIEVCLTIPAGA